MDRTKIDEQEDSEKGGNIAVEGEDLAGTNIPDTTGQPGIETPRDRTETASDRDRRERPAGLTGGYGTGGLEPQEQPEESEA